MLLREPSRFVAVSLAALCAAVGGCASAPWVNQHIEAVNAEYRELEMYSYELEKENARLTDTVESLQDENTRLKGGTPPARRSGPFRAPATLTDPAPRTNSGIRPRLDPDPPAVEVPEITVPDTPAPSLPPTLPPTRPANPAAPRPFPGGASTSRPSSNVSSQKPPEASLPLLPSAPKPPRPILDDPPPEPTGAPELNGPASDLPAPAPEGLVPEPIDKKVTHLFLNPILTRGANFDARPGDDGIAVVLEPRNQAGQFVPRAAPVTIVVLNPTKQGDAARVARWTLDESLLANRINRSRDQQGIHLQLPWSGGVPEASQLKMFVRYEAPDGRKVEAQHDLILNPAAQALGRWTPRNGAAASSAVAGSPTTSPALTANPPATTLEQANPPLPKPAVRSDLSRVIQEPTTPPAIASKEPAIQPGTSQPAAEQPAPGLLAPPPPGKPAPQRPEWKPFR